MFESDQSDLHDEIEELRQASRTTVKDRPEVHDTSFYESFVEEEDDHRESPIIEDEPKKKFPLVLVGFGAVAVLILLLLVLTQKKKTDGPLPGDLGQGIVADAGLRGHLVTQWDGNAKSGRVQYQLRIEPIGPVQAPGFAHVAADPQAPLSINLRVLDQSGFALCGKEVLFRFDPKSVPVPTPASVKTQGGKKISAKEAAAAAQAAAQAALAQAQAQEADRERGKDLFQNQAGEDGVVSAVNAQGTLPCSPDQYKRAYYWDFTTNFPAVAEQEAMLNPKKEPKPKRESPAQRRVASFRDVGPSKSASKRALSAYYLQGDDRVNYFDPAHGVLEGSGGKSFTIASTPDRTIVANWAHNYSLIHYKCDQHATCSLTSAGGTSVVYARINE
jgi:hypothetical protein